MAVVVLDACALIAYLRDEDGSERIKEVLLRPEDSVIMHVINVGEVFYDGLKRNIRNRRFME